MFNEEVRVKGNISIDGRVNEVSLKMFVTTDTEQELTNSYNFTGNVQVNDVEAHGFVGDVNITDWMARSVKKLSPLPQNINETWTVSGNLRFIQDVRGTGDLNGFNVVGMAKELEERKKQKYIVEKNILVSKLYRNNIKTIHMCLVCNYGIRIAQDNRIFVILAPGSKILQLGFLKVQIRDR